MESTNIPTKSDEKQRASNVQALYFIALFVVAIIPFLVHFNLLYAPLQGEELRLTLSDDAMHHPDTAITHLDRISGSPLAAFALGLFWQLGSGATLVLRAVAVLAWVVGALLLAQAIRLWLNRTDSMTAPLLGGLLFALSPVSVSALTAVNVWPALFGVVFAIAALAFFLKATTTSQVDYLNLMVSCIALALSIAAYPGLFVLPLALAIIDMTRLSIKGGLRLKPSWTAWFALGGTSVAVALAFRYSGGAISFSTPVVVSLILSTVSVLLLAWLMTLLPGKPLRAAIAGITAILVVASGAYSFHEALGYMDPLGTLEQACSQSDNPENQDALILQYIESSRNAADPETRQALLQEALAVWQLDGKEKVNDTRRILGQRLFEAGNAEEASQLLKPYLQEIPFGETGAITALALARAASTKETPRQAADYYAFAQKNDLLTLEDNVRYSKTLMQMGDMANAAQQLAGLPDLEEDNEITVLKKQANTAYSAAQELLDKARETMTEDPKNPESFVMSAQREMLLGDNVRAFYWLELALRRDPDQEQAWSLIGVLFARHNQADQFIAQWGTTKPHGDQAWLKLAQQAALFQSWDGALVFVNQFVTDETPSAEEILAAFALELRNTKKAREWLEKATVERPESHTPWLLLADLAIALQQPEEAQKNLQEAKKRSAPAEEIEKRKTHLQGGAPEASEAKPFEPVRSYIQ